MRNIILILLAFSAHPVMGQVSAVMEVRVEVISSAGLHLSQPMITELPASEDLTEVNAGYFTLLTAPEAEINISYASETFLFNKWGDRIEVQSLHLDRSQNINGTHQITVGGMIKKSVAHNGSYGGTVTAVVDYL